MEKGIEEYVHCATYFETYLEINGLWQKRLQRICKRSQSLNFVTTSDGAEKIQNDSSVKILDLLTAFGSVQISTSRIID